MKKIQQVLLFSTIFILMISFFQCSKKNDNNDIIDDPPQDTTDLFPCWSQLYNLKYGRIAHMVVSVENKIYAIGGGVNGSRCEAYDLSSKSWSTKANLPSAREFLSGCVINGKIYTIGGWYDDMTYDVVEVYNPETNSWSSKSPMPTKRWGHAAIEMNGLIYIFGGARDWPITKFYNVIDIYDPQQDTWTTKAGNPKSGLYPRWGFSACMVNGKIYFMGGDEVIDYPPQGTSIPALDIVEEYNPVTQEWKLKTPMPTARWGLAIVSVNNMIYAFGGGTSYYATKTLDIVERYDPITDTWVTKSPMPKGRIALAACEKDNLIYIPGGGGITANIAYPEFFVYDPACDTIE